MGYACYNTPRGPAGYDVTDTCHQPGCTVEIDRGLDCLCGDQPGEPGNHGCGWWFCAEHLFSYPDQPHTRGYAYCEQCCEDGGPDETPGSRYSRA
jgi:hypothetical protein